MNKYASGLGLGTPTIIYIPSHAYCHHLHLLHICYHQQICHIIVLSIPLLDTSIYSFQDVLSTEDWALDMVPKPVAGVVMLYPISPNQEAHRNTEAEKEQSVDDKGRKERTSLTDMLYMHSSTLLLFSLPWFLTSLPPSIHLSILPSFLTSLPPCFFIW